MFKQIKAYILTIMSTFFLSYVGNPDLSIKHIDGFFFVVKELNRDEIQLYNNFMVYKAWAKILTQKRTLYLNDPKVIKCLFKNLSDTYIQGCLTRPQFHQIPHDRVQKLDRQQEEIAADQFRKCDPALHETLLHVHVAQKQNLLQAADQTMRTASGVAGECPEN